MTPMTVGLKFGRGRGIIACSLVVLSLTTFASAFEQWPRWRGLRADGTWNGPPLQETWPADGLKQVWRQSIGGGYAGVVAFQDRVLTMDRQTQPSEVERVLCFDAKTGEPVWAHQYAVQYGNLDYGNGPRAAPTVSENRVYTLGAMGHVRCLDFGTGREIWSKDMVADYKARVPMWGFAASPVIYENLVIVHTGAEPDGSYIAFDRITGDEKWRSLPDPAGYATPIIITHNGQDQLIAWTPENVRSLNPKTGALFWTVPYKVTYGVSIATPIFQEGIVFVSGYWEGSKAIRLGREPRDAEVLWEDNRHLRGLMSQPLYRDGHGYSLDKQHGLICFELKSGQKVWDDGNRMTPRGRNPQASLVWLSDGSKPSDNDRDRAIILNAEGDLILARLNPTGYQEQSRTNIIKPTEKGPVWAHPAYSGHFVYARNDVELICVSLQEALR